MPNLNVCGSAATTWFRDRHEYIHVAWYKTIPGFEPPETKLWRQNRSPLEDVLDAELRKVSAGVCFRPKADAASLNLNGGLPLLEPVELFQHWTANGHTCDPCSAS